MTRNKLKVLRIIAIILIISAVAVSAALFYSMKHTSNIYDDANGITGDLFSSRKSAYELQIASDYLTEQVRSFVITGEKEYLDKYFEEANVTKRRDNAIAQLETGYGDSKAFNDLSGAMEESMELMQSEFYAARLAVDAYGYDIKDYPAEIQDIKLEDWTSSLAPDEKKSEAEKILFGTDYQKRKDSISSYMQSCLEELDEEMERKQEEAASSLDRQLFAEHLLTVLLIVILLANIIFTAYLVICQYRA